MRILKGICGTFGALLIIGIGGGLDINTMGLVEAIIRAIIGGSLILTSVAIHNHQKRKDEE